MRRTRAPGPAGRTEGIYRVAADELAKFQAQPQHRLKWERRFSLADGVRGSPAQVRPLPTLAVANDGRVFYATNSQVGWIDPRTLRRNLRAPDVLVLGLRSSQCAAQIVAELCSELQALDADVGGRLTLQVSDGVERVRLEVARELCQVLKEAVSNAVRHAGASAIRAELIVSASGIEAAVLDDGIGIAPEVAQSGRPGHWGIIGMRERIVRLGGTMTIARNGATGTALRVRLDAAACFV